MQSLLVLTGLLACSFAWVKEQENSGLYEGDILLHPSQRQNIAEGKHAFASRKTNLWPSTTIAYSIDPSLSSNTEAMRGIRSALDDYHKYTCLRFVPRKNEQSYMYLYNSGGGCFSGVGFSLGSNSVSLSSGCWSKHTVLHEIGHSLGMYHEQSRPDRDQYVEIIWNNIATSQRHNFDREHESKIDSRGTTYDYRSMMHYNQNAFGDGRRTIKTKNPYYQNLIGNGQGFSETDVRQLNLMYGCKQTTHTFPPTMTPSCYDEMSVCSGNAAEGKCNDRSWKTFMHRSCRFSCGLCTGADTPSPWTPAPPTVGPGGKCVDRHTNCLQFKGYCRTHGWLEHMQTNCAATCGFVCH